jgi:hypothetical protein
MSKARDIASAAPAPSTVDATELGYLDGVTSAIQTQLDAKTAKSTLTTTGDIYYASAANTPARLGIGTASQLLAVNSGATAPEWVAAPSAGSNWSLLNAGGTALTAAATITVSGISGKDKIMALIVNASSANANSNIGIQLNTDTGSNYYAFGTKMTGFTAWSSDLVDRYSQNGITQARIGVMANAANSTVSGAITITGCNSSGLKQFITCGGGVDLGANQYQQSIVSQGYYDSASTISSISVISSTGNFDAGTVYVYTSA